MKKIYLSSFVFVLCFSFLFLLPKISQALATTITLNPSADAYIDNKQGDGYFGDDNELDVSYLFSMVKQRSLIQFDLSSIPANAVINSASLSIYMDTCIDSTESRILHIDRTTTAWEEYTAHWDNLKNKPSAMYTGQAPCSNVNSYLTYSVTSLVAGWYDGTYSNYGFYLWGDENSSYNRKFTSRENPTNKPKLTIDYAAPTQPSNGATSTGTDQKSNLESSNQTVDSPKATSAAKKATPSATVKKEAGISAARMALLGALIILLGAIVAGYFIYRRRKGKLAKKEEVEKPKEPPEGQPDS